VGYFELLNMAPDKLIAKLRRRVLETDSRDNRLVIIKRGAVSRIAEALGVSHGTVTGWILRKHSPIALHRRNLALLLIRKDLDFLPLKTGPNAANHENFHTAFSE
jgi:hypothetical protein